MSDLAVGFGVALILEGLLWALALGVAMKALTEAAAAPRQVLQATAWSAVALGLLIVWLIRG